MAEASGVQTGESAEHVDSAPTTDSVGARLRIAREAAGLDLRQLSQLTKVTARHLQAIEEGRYADLPGRPYAIGFAKSYARAVGLNDAEVADAVRAELQAAEPVQPARVIHQYEIGEPVKTPSSRLTWLAAAVAVAVIVVGFVAWRSYYWPAAGLPPVAAPEPLPAARPAAAPPAQTAARPAGPVTFTALEEGIWVKFYDSAGTQLLQKQLAKGESYTVPTEANGPQIWTGRPEALAITVGGQPVPKLAEVQVTMKDVPVSASALLARTASGAASVQASPAEDMPSGPVASATRPSTATM